MRRRTGPTPTTVEPDPVDRLVEQHGRLVIDAPGPALTSDEIRELRRGEPR